MSSMVRAFGLCALILLTACQSTSEQDKLAEPLDLEAYVKEAKLSKLWSNNIGAGQGDSLTELQPIIYGNDLYIADSKGSVYRFDKKTGKKLWRTKLKEALISGAGFGEGAVYVGSAQGVLISLAADTGLENWRTNIGSEILAPAAGARGIVVAQTATGSVVGLNARSGEEIWRYSSVVPKLTVRGTSTPVIVEGIAFIGLANGKLIALDINNGIERWSTRLASAKGDSDIERITDVDTTPILLGGNLIAGSLNGYIAMVDAVSGQIYWREEASVMGDVSEGFGNVYFSSDNGEISAYDLSKGQLKWINENLLRRGLSNTATWINYIAVADYKGYLHILSQVDGRVVARKRIDKHLPQAPFVVNDRVLYTFSNNGTLSAFTISSIE